MAVFVPGSSHTALAQVTNPMSVGFDYVAELYLGVDRAASSGQQNFSLAAHETRDISFPVTMPGIEGDFPVYLDVFSGGMLVGAYQALEDVTIASGEIGIAPLEWIDPSSYTREGDTLVFWPRSAYLVKANVQNMTAEWLATHSIAIKTGAHIEGADTRLQSYTPTPAAGLGQWGFLYFKLVTYDTQQLPPGTFDVGLYLVENGVETFLHNDPLRIRVRSG